ncbi:MULTISPECIES: SDR family NAD(P)-dependent oxidoreductase [unclassified Mycolicibacterium]|uniref:SDR family NAD(P)-dependent oxidoreductase n=1 Tax=unclassified Mycolicibacterium TaxID=2636767 RepID=UPI0012DD57E5|nr:MULTISPECIES: SDR family oxidoreductase [unclassified Mycolicibacterium]MUL84426.1 SDR family oxidoreductase [Mycolicibacterium sp. CBMA 329]MUL88201.1 SDR family oxidoreductase [Mycolicibacterium sp. CBMA 331]MUL99350.1 SDR family oxidoreductase [Mycolicibacterium sp. CBMA 334]MUM27978.1 SDR family oxidoreductase [Mycolicibacterium sp. CBMA 295]MUM39848.1 SDR family oxidoreductase [Mycolicibacterium sp. CBMA 247]
MFTEPLRTSDAHQFTEAKIGPALAGKVAVVTGATGGIGAAAAEVFAAHGACVLISGRQVDRGESLAARLGSSVAFHRADVADESQMRGLIEHALERFGRLDVLINNAGTSGTLGSVEELDLDAFADTLRVHVLGMAAGIKYAARPMSAQGAGSIVNVASLGGHVAGWTPVDYSVAKAAVLQLTRCAAVELGERGVRVNSISPGPIPTGIQLKTTGIDSAEAEQAAPALQAMFASALPTWQPMKRVGQPNDVAAALLWLASDASSFINGQDLAIDGGICAGRPASISANDYVQLSQLLKQ